MPDWQAQVQAQKESAAPAEVPVAERDSAEAAEVAVAALVVADLA